MRTIAIQHFFLSSLYELPVERAFQPTKLSNDKTSIDPCQLVTPLLTTSSPQWEKMGEGPAPGFIGIFSRPPSPGPALNNGYTRQCFQGLMNQASQGLQIAPVGFIAARSFQQHWKTCETRIVEQKAKGIEPQFSLANVLMPVDTAAQSLF